MTNIALKIKNKYEAHSKWLRDLERDSWELTQEEIITGLYLFENNKTVCSEMGDGNYAVEPYGERYLYLVFDPEEVMGIYMKIYGVEWPRQVDRLSDEELHAMFEDVREYLDVDYHNVFTEERILTIYVTKKI